MLLRDGGTLGGKYTLGSDTCRAKLCGTRGRSRDYWMGGMEWDWEGNLGMGRWMIYVRHVQLPITVKPR